LNSKKKDTHQFAFFVSSLTSFLPKQNSANLRISDEKLFHRIIRVLRMDIGETCVLFDEKHNVHFELVGTEGKKQIDGRVIQKQKNKIFSPAITFFLPLLKREHFEIALYSLVELGATVVQPIVTQKTQRKWSKKEYDRSFQIMVAAAEQSKNFSFPELKKPISLDEACKASSDLEEKIFFDPSGKKLVSVIGNYKDKNLILMVGPEGDLTDAEKTLLQKHNFSFCSLTPTVLRSLQAAALSVGIVRSFFST